MSAAGELWITLEEAPASLHLMEPNIKIKFQHFEPLFGQKVQVGRMDTSRGSWMGKTWEAESCSMISGNYG